MRLDCVVTAKRLCVERTQKENRERERERNAHTVSVSFFLKETSSKSGGRKRCGREIHTHYILKTKNNNLVTRKEESQA